MRLLELILFRDHRKLKGNERFKFYNDNILCIAGENGSGKTQLLGIINVILSVAALNNIQIEVVAKFNLKIELKGKEIFITNKDGKIEIFQRIGDQKQILEREYLRNNLNIITYSSAKRTMLSNPHYFEILEKIKTNGNHKECFNYFIREKLKKSILIYLFLFNYEELNKVLGDIISIKTITRIQLDIESNLKEILSEEQRKTFKSILQKTYKDIENGLKISLEKKELEEIKKHYKDNKFHFFSLLESLEKLNFIEKLKIDEYQTLFSGIISEKIEDNYLSDKFFISDIYFEGDIDSNDEIRYQFLSEGELQLLETLGSVILFQNKEFQKENLYLFDEPATHLNATWMSNYVTLLQKALSIKSDKESQLNSQLIFSTHNSDIISDLPADNLHLIKDGKFEIIREETFGSSDFKLNKILFNKTTSVSNNVLSKIEEYYNRASIDISKEELEKLEEEIEIIFASSPEKYKLLKYIDDKLFKLRKRD